jgi:TonB family protein
MVPRVIRRLAWTFAGCGFLICSAASAQNQPVTSRQPPPWTLRVPSLLHLSESQASAFQSYVQALPPNPSPPMGVSQFRDLTALERLEYVAGLAARDAKSLSSQVEALRSFHATLTPEQRALFDDFTRPPPETIGVAADPIDVPHPDKPDYKLPSQTDPSWLIKPRGEDMARVYPSAAMRLNTAGKTVLKCTADENGYLKDCVIESESPAGMGFGNAGLEMSAYMRMVPATVYGIPHAAEVTIPLVFSPD